MKYWSEENALQFSHKIRAKEDWETLQKMKLKRIVELNDKSIELWKRIREVVI